MSDTALRLAAILEDEKMHSMAIDTEAAAELRRLHALNAELVKTLKWLDNWLGEKPMPECVDRIRGALAKVEASNGL